MSIEYTTSNTASKKQSDEDDCNVNLAETPDMSTDGLRNAQEASEMVSKSSYTLMRDEFLDQENNINNKEFKYFQ